MRKKVKLLWGIMMLFLLLVINKTTTYAEEKDISQVPGTIVKEGSCGENATWVLYGDGTLKISGTGVIGYGEKNKSCISVDGVKSLVIEDGITEISDYAFYDCITLSGELQLPKTLTRIGDFAFYHSGNFSGSLVIPEGVTSIGNYAFSRYPLDSSESWASGKLKLPETLKSIGDGAFTSCNGFIGDLIIPEGVTSLGNNVFEYCGFNGVLKLPKSLKYIGNKTFHCCDKFRGDLVIPEGVTSIGDYAFYDSGNFSGNLVIPEGVTSIGDYAFARHSLAGVNNWIGGELQLPKTLRSIGDNAFENCDRFAGDLIIPEGVTSIGIKSFYNCRGFDGKLKLSESLRIISDYAFCQCENFIGDLVIPEGVTQVGDSAFWRCNGFDGEIKLPETLSIIGGKAFAECYGITGNLVIPVGVRTIDTCAFHDCEKINQITIWNSKCSIFQHSDHEVSWLAIPKNAIIVGYKDSTAYEYAKRNNRRFKSIEKCDEHIWEEKTVVIKKSTCKEAGIEEYSCANCIETKTETTVKSGHLYKWKISKKATASASGYKYGTCSLCGYKTGKTTINKISTQKLSYTKVLYNGVKQIPQLIIKDSKGNILEEAEDYTVTLPTGRTEIGRYKFYIKYKGDYSGTKTLYYTIIPTTPEYLRANLSTASGGYDDVKLTWSAPSSGATGYRVYYRRATSTKWSYITSTTKKYYTKKNLLDGIEYDFKVVAYYKSKSSSTKYYDAEEFDVTSIYTLKKVGTPTISEADNGMVKITWKDIEGALGYQISQATSKSKTTILSSYVAANKTSCVVSAPAGKTRYYKVRAYREVDGKKVYGPWSYVKSYKLK